MQAKPLAVHYRQCADRVPNYPCICKLLTALIGRGSGHPPPGPTTSSLHEVKSGERAQRASLDEGIE
jgi:hypothetical protein